MTERRKRLRIKYDVPLKITRYNGTQIQARGLNMSVQGLALSTELSLVCGETVQIELNLQGEAEVLMAQVAYAVSANTPQAGHQIGLEFIDLTDGQRTRIEEHVYSKAESVSPQPLSNMLSLKY